MVEPYPTVMPQYRGAAAAKSRWRGIADIAAKLLLAAGYGVLVVLLPQTSLYMLGIPVLIMLLLILWMLPDNPTVPLGGIERIFSLFFILNIAWPVYIAVAIPGLPWLTPTRALLFILIFLFLYSVSSSSGLRHHMITVARSSKGVWLCFLGWQTMMIVTLPMSRSIGDSMRRLFDTQISLAAMFLLGCILFTRRRWATWTVAALVVLGVITSLDGWLELYLGYPPWANHIPSFMRVDERLMANVLGTQARSADGLYRVRGPNPNSLLFAEFLALCIPFVLHWMATGRSLVLRLAMIVAWWIITITIISTQSRLGLVGEILGHLLYLPMWAWRRWRVDKSGLIAPSLIFGFPAIAGAIVVLILSSTTLSTRILGGGAQGASDQSRRIQREMAVPKILANPIGYGLNMAAGTLNFRARANRGITIDNHYITTILELGVVGFVSFYGMFLIGARNGVELYLETDDRETELAGPIAVMMVEFFVIKSVLSQENNHTIVFILLGMLLALKAREMRLVPDNGTFPRPIRPEELPVVLPGPATGVPALG